MNRLFATTTLLASVAARTAFAHPGHGLPGWLHHAEPWLLLGAVAALLLVRRVAGRA